MFINQECKGSPYTRHCPESLGHRWGVSHASHDHVGHRFARPRGRRNAAWKRLVEGNRLRRAEEIGSGGTVAGFRCKLSNGHSRLLHLLDAALFALLSHAARAAAMWAVSTVLYYLYCVVRSTRSGKQVSTNKLKYIHWLIPSQPTKRNSIQKNVNTKLDLCLPHTENGLSLIEYERGRVQHDVDKVTCTGLTLHGYPRTKRVHFLMLPEGDTVNSDTLKYLDFQGVSNGGPLVV